MENKICYYKNYILLGRYAMFFSETDLLEFIEENDVKFRF